MDVMKEDMEMVGVKAEETKERGEMEAGDLLW